MRLFVYPCAHSEQSFRFVSLSVLCMREYILSSDSTDVLQNENCNFVKARGRGAKKMAHVREYPHESSCGRPSSRTNFSFRDRTFVR